jgi:uncharacterized protein (TIGR02996 family)
MVCPRCGKKDITGKKFGFGDVTLYEFNCNSCDLFEFRRSTDPDFDAWWARWHPDGDDDEDAQGAASDDEDGDEAAEPAPAASSPASGKPAPTAKARDQLQDAICRDVANDALRLQYADELARKRPERAEFIRLQVERARNERASRATRSAPTPRESELRKRFGAEWAHFIDPFARPYASDAPYRGWEWERGFVAELRTDPDMVADPREYIFNSSPIEHLDLTTEGSVLAALAAPRVAQVRSFGLRDLRLGDDDMEALVRDARLDRCEWLDLRSNNIGERGVKALAASPRIRAIPIVLLTFNPSDPATQFSDGEMWLPPEGAELEKAYGRIPWLHLPPPRRLPDRYHAPYVTYIDEE